MAERNSGWLWFTVVDTDDHHKVSVVHLDHTEWNDEFELVAGIRNGPVSPVHELNFCRAQAPTSAAITLPQQVRLESMLSVGLGHRRLFTGETGGKRDQVARYAKGG